MGNNRSKVPDLEKLVKGGRKKFVRYEEGAMLYSMGIHTFQQLAKDARAVYHIFDVCTRVWGIGIPIKRLTRRYAVAIKWRYGNTWVDLALIYEPSYIYKRWRGKIQGVREKNFRKIKITQKLDF